MLDNSKSGPGVSPKQIMAKMKSLFFNAKHIVSYSNIINRNVESDN